MQLPRAYGEAYRAKTILAKMFATGRVWCRQPGRQSRAAIRVFIPQLGRVGCAWQRGIGIDGLYAGLTFFLFEFHFVDPGFGVGCHARTDALPPWCVPCVPASIRLTHPMASPHPASQRRFCGHAHRAGRQAVSQIADCNHYRRQTNGETSRVQRGRDEPTCPHRCSHAIGEVARRTGRVDAHGPNRICRTHIGASTHGGAASISPDAATCSSDCLHQNGLINQGQLVAAFQGLTSIRPSAWPTLITRCDIDGHQHAVSTRWLAST